MPFGRASGVLYLLLPTMEEQSTTPHHNTPIPHHDACRVWYRIVACPTLPHGVPAWSISNHIWITDFGSHNRTDNVNTHFYSQAKSQQGTLRDFLFQIKATVPSDLKRLEARLMIGRKVKNIRLFGFSDWFLCRRRSFNDHLTESIETCKCRRLQTPPSRLGSFLTAPREAGGPPVALFLHIGTYSMKKSRDGRNIHN
jgi:hypothetical protein